jgi:aquaporin Z
LATALYAGGEALSQVWLFWVAPPIGAAIGGLFAKWLLNE